MLVNSSSPVEFKIQRGGGTLIGAGIYVWANVGKLDQKCVSDSQLASTASVEPEHIDLDLGSYVVVVRDAGFGKGM